MSEHDEQAEHERAVGRAVIEDARQRNAAALALWERNRRISVIVTVIVVAGIVVMAFITPVPLARWSSLVIAVCIAAWCWKGSRRPDQG